MGKMSELRWIRITMPSLIPISLVEQIKKRDFEVHEFYKYHESLCCKITPDGVTLNPYSHLYVLSNPSNLIKGFLWFTVDPLSKNIFIQTYSVDPEYWKGSGAVEKLCEHVKEIRKKANLKKIYWITAYPKHSKRHGFKSSKDILMEYSEEEEKEDGKNTDGGCDTRVEHRTPDTPTEGISEQHTGP